MKATKNGGNEGGKNRFFFAEPEAWRQELEASRHGEPARAAEVVLVEDNPLDAELALRALRVCNLAERFLHLRDGQEALDYLFPEVGTSGGQGPPPDHSQAQLHQGPESARPVFGGQSGSQDSLGPLHRDLPRVILLDLKLPKRGGVEVLSAVRNHPRTRFLPVVVLTSSREECDLCLTYNLGANSYIVKPVNYERYVEAVTILGFYWLTLNELPLNLASPVASP